MQSWFGGLANSFRTINSCCAPDNIKQFDEVVCPTSAREAKEVTGDASSRMVARAPYQKEFYNRAPAGRYSGFILRAAERGDAALLIAALKVDGHLIEGKDASGNTALHIAARNGHSSICELLCQVGDLGFILQNSCT